MIDETDFSERLVVGGFFSPDVIPVSTLLRLLGNATLRDPFMQRIVTACRAYHDAGQLVTIETVRDSFAGNDEVWFTDLAGECINEARRARLIITDHIEDVRRDWMTREVRERIGRDFNVNDTVEWFIAERANAPVHIPAQYNLEQYDREMAHVPERLSWGIYQFDDVKATLPAGGLSIFAGRTSHGKSLMLQHIARNVASGREGYRVVYVTVEEPCRAIGTRWIKMGSRESLEEMLTSGRLNLIYCGGQDCADIISQIKALHEVKKIDVACVDYLQKIKSTNRSDQRYLQIAAVASDLQELAATTGIAVVAGAQLGRSADDAKRPTLGHLREAADIEQEASLVVLMRNWSLHDGERDFTDARMEFWVAKNRDERVGGNVTGWLDGETLHLRIDQLAAVTF